MIPVSRENHQHALIVEIKICLGALDFYAIDATPARRRRAGLTLAISTFIAPMT